MGQNIIAIEKKDKDLDTRKNCNKEFVQMTQKS